MSNEELKAKLTAAFPELTYDETQEWIQVNAEPGQWIPLAGMLRNDPDLNFDYLFCLTCIDWKTHLAMVYHFSSTKHRHSIVVKSKLDRANPVIHTVCHIWRTAELHEREVYDLFGVKFTAHPDLRRLFLTDEWKGFPLRKDYEDPVNMIKL